jgi:hypothetical protein
LFESLTNSILYLLPYLYNNIHQTITKILVDWILLQRSNSHTFALHTTCDWIKYSLTRSCCRDQTCTHLPFIQPVTGSNTRWLDLVAEIKLAHICPSYNLWLDQINVSIILFYCGIRSYILFSKKMLNMILVSPF